MIKKRSKYFVFVGAVLAFSLLLASCQSLITSNEEINRQRALDAWGANLTAQGERYMEEMEQASVPLIELTSDVPREIKRTSIPWVELRSDVPREENEMVETLIPGIKISHSRVAEKTILTVYTVKSDGPAWVVFHADENGVPGKILGHAFVESGTHRIAKSEVLGEMSSEKIHVMLHHDWGTIGLFEFPGLDGPIYVDNEIINDFCSCPF